MVVCHRTAFGLFGDLYLASSERLSLAGYLTVTAEPAPVLVAVLLGIAVLMTALIYLAFIKLLRLPFSLGYAAFTFPMMIGATALFKVATLAETLGLDAATINQLRWMAEGESVIATLVVSYVALRFAQILIHCVKLWSNWLNDRK